MNYDILFELSAMKNGLNVDYFDINTDKVSCLKLHGSSNFVPAGNHTFGNIHVSGVNMFSFGEMGPAECDKIQKFYDPDYAGIAPIMAMYMENKPLQSTSDKIKQTQGMFNKSVINAEKVLIIGVRPNPNDKHIWDSISQTKAEIGYIGSQEESKSWFDQYRQDKKNTFIGRYWKDHFENSVSFLR